MRAHQFARSKNKLPSKRESLNHFAADGEGTPETTVCLGTDVLSGCALARCISLGSFPPVDNNTPPFIRYPKLECLSFLILVSTV